MDSIKLGLLAAMAMCLALAFCGKPAHAGTVIVTDGRDGTVIGQYTAGDAEPPVNPAYVRASAMCHRQADPAAVAACMMHVNSAFIVIR